MNVFRFGGDLAHLASILLLIYSIELHKSFNGLSLKTQFLFFLVFITRYLDLFTNYVSLYNTCMKLFFIASSSYIIYIMVFKFQEGIKAHVDTFPMKYIVALAAVLAVLTTKKYTILLILWTFSIWLEAGAIVPQFFVLQRTGEAENITAHYLFALGIYRALYIPNWLYRYYVEGRFDWIAVTAGVIQTLIYADFFYIYYTKVLQGKKFELPV